MTKFLRHQKAVAFATGVGATAAIYVSTKAHLWNVTAETSNKLPGAAPQLVAEAPEAPEPIFGAAVRAWAVRRWNEGVDAIFKPIVAELSRRNL